MLIYIVRHAETALNKEMILVGRKEVPLNETGRLQAEETCEALRGVKFDLVISSPSGRARETAEIILGGRDVPMITDDRLHEINWGEWDGLPNAGAAPQMAEAMKLFYRDPLHFQGAPGGETLVSVLKRGSDFFKELTADRKYGDKTILVVTHACTVRGILNTLYEEKERFWQEGVPLNCSVNIVRVLGGKAELLERDRIYYDSSLSGDYYKD